MGRRVGPRAEQYPPRLDPNASVTEEPDAPAPWIQGAGAVPVGALLGVQPPSPEWGAMLSTNLLAAGCAIRLTRAFASRGRGRRAKLLRCSDRTSIPQAGPA